MEGEPRRGRAGPAGLGGSFPSRSRQQPWLHGHAAVGPAGPCGSSSGWKWPGTPAHGGRCGRGSGGSGGSGLRGVPPVDNVCFTAALAGCMQCQGGAGGGGALKGHWSPRASGRTQVRLPGMGRKPPHPAEGMPHHRGHIATGHTHMLHTLQSDSLLPTTIRPLDLTTLLTPKCFQSYANHTHTHT